MSFTKEQITKQIKEVQERNNKLSSDKKWAEIKNAVILSLE